MFVCFFKLTTALPFEFLFVQDIYSVFYSLISHMHLLRSITLSFTIRMHSILMSVIPNNAGLPPGTTKNLHSLVNLCPNITLHTLNCLMPGFWHVFNTTL